MRLFRAGLLRPSRHHVVDLVGCGLLVALALVGFRTTYAGSSWAVAGLVGILVGLAAAHVGASLRLPGLVTTALAAVGYLALGGPVATRDGLIGGVLPSPATISGLARTAVDGWKQLLTTYPPVDPQGPLMALPFLFGLAGAGAAYGIARRWIGALRALVVPTALLLLAILLGTLEPAGVLAQGLAFALVAIGYAAARAARTRPTLPRSALSATAPGLVGAARARTTRAVTTLVLLVLAGAAAVLLGPRLPGAGEAPRTVWRTAMEPPFDVAAFPSPLAGFRRYTEPNPAQLYDRTLFTVAGLPAGTPVRIATLDSYDGAVWGAGAGRAEAFRRVGAQVGVTPPAEATPAIVSIQVPEGGWGDVWLPTAGVVSGIGFAGPRAGALHADLRFNTETATGIVPLRLVAGDSYQLHTHLLPVANPPDVALAAEPAAGPGVGQAGAAAAGAGSGLSVLDAKIDAWTSRESTPWRKLMATAAVFKGSGAYTDGGVAGDYQNVFLPGHSLARVTRFVRAPQLAGDDEQYAAVLALVAARLGVPARVVLGALPGDGGVVKGRDVHAWVEVRRADGGWQPILPGQFLPDRNKKPEQTNDSSDEKKAGALVPPPAANNPPSILQGPDQAQNTVPNRSQGAKKSFFDPSDWPRWVQLLLLYAGPVLLLGLLAVAVVLVAKRRRRVRRRTRGSPADRVEGAWAELLDTATDLRLPVPRYGTRLEQAHALERASLSPPVSDPAVRPGAGPAGVPGVVLLAAASDAHVFGPVPPTDADAAGHWSGAHTAIRGLRAGQPRRRRLRAAVSIRSLRARPAPAVATRHGAGPVRTPAHLVAAAHRRALALAARVPGGSELRSRMTGRGGGRP